ncbi:MAG: SmpA/OmlA domain protein [Candidatus Ruthia sp. Asou_11_S2]|nr:SmpA/OmlA domain protein [Candidatus Ruthia sp. Asou_11_S2]
MPDMSLLTLYKDDIHQGSVLERFKINQLKLGMSKIQVQDLIGSPSIIDSFHNNQWDYINHSTLHKKDDIHYRLVLTFNDDALTHINTTDIGSLSQLTDKEKEAENKRISDEKEEKIAKEKALAKAKIKALEEKRINNEKAAEIAKEKALAEAKVLESYTKQPKKPIRKFANHLENSTSNEKVVNTKIP